MIVVVRGSHGILAANDESAVVVAVNVASGFRVLLDIAQALIAIGIIVPVVQAEIVAARKLLGKDVAVNVARCGYLVEARDVEAAGNAKPFSCHGITERIVVGALKSILGGVTLEDVLAVFAWVDFGALILG